MFCGVGAPQPFTDAIESLFKSDLLPHSRKIEVTFDASQLILCRLTEVLYPDLVGQF